MITTSKIHFALIKSMIDRGIAPSPAELATQLSATEPDVCAALQLLQEQHGVVLHPNSCEVWAVHPFATSPTPFYVRSAKGQWWGNCAWCSLGIAALVDEDVTIATSLGAEGSPVEIRVSNGAVCPEDLLIHFPIPMRRAWDNVVYTCSNMLVFANNPQVDDWCARHGIPKGDVQPITTIWEFSKKWYGNHLNPSWVKWTADQARRMFAEFGLTHEVWELDESGERF